MGKILLLALFLSIASVASDRLLVQFENSEAADEFRKKEAFSFVKKVEPVFPVVKRKNQREWDSLGLGRWYRIETDGEIRQSQMKRLREVVGKVYLDSRQVQLFERTPNDPDFDLQWALHRMKAHKVWKSGTDCGTKPIFIIDTGVDRTHPDLQGNIWVNEGEKPDNGLDDDENGYIDDVYGWNFVDNNNITTDFYGTNGHGTFVTGVIAARGDNRRQVAGVCWRAKVGSLIMYTNRPASESDLARAYVYVAEMGASVVNHSYGRNWEMSQLYKDAMTYSVKAGVLHVAAAGNGDNDLVIYPAGMDGVISVAATTVIDKRAGFSNFGKWIDISAPGQGILGLKRGGGRRISYGTSYSSPYVAGAAAYLRSRFPKETPAQITNRLFEGADDLGVPGFDPAFGWGRLNLEKSVTVSVSHRR